MQIQQVLVPIDFSPLSRLALNYAIAFAREFQARVTLLHVVETSTALNIAFPDEAGQIERDHRDQSRRMLKALIAPGQLDLHIETIVKTGHAEQQILSTIRDEGIDLAVLGTHGSGLVARYLIGSVTHRILRNTQIPVLTVSHANRPPAFDRILLATDLAETSKDVSRLAFGLAQNTHGNVVAVHAVEVGVEGGAEAAVYLGESRLREARAKIDELKAEASHRKIPLETVVVEGAASDAILNAADDKSVDCIMITLRKSAHAEETVLGSTAERVIREARQPVLTIPVLATAEPADKPRAA